MVRLSELKAQNLHLERELEGATAPSLAVQVVTGAGERLDIAVFPEAPIYDAIQFACQGETPPPYPALVEVGSQGHSHPWGRSRGVGEGGRIGLGAHPTRRRHFRAMGQCHIPPPKPANPLIQAVIAVNEGARLGVRLDSLEAFSAAFQELPAEEQAGLGEELFMQADARQVLPIHGGRPLSVRVRWRAVPGPVAPTTGFPWASLTLACSLAAGAGGGRGPGATAGAAARNAWAGGCFGGRHRQGK